VTADRVLAQTRALFASGADLTLLLAPELTGERARINIPGTVGGANWTYRLPAPIEDLAGDAAVNARMRTLREMAREAGR
jgi:4-alpha-glucanotransferase